MSSGVTVIDQRFQLIEPLGSGGMGTVWRAFDLALHREVALKEVRAEADSPVTASVHRERVLREARALARIGHPNVVAIHHIVDTPAEAHPWIVMELVRGRSLADVLATDRLTTAQAAQLGRGILAALRAAHAVGVLHRDVKPANVLVREDGSPVLTDFGIAAIHGMTGLTSTGSVVGSLDYVAPERLNGIEGNPASDLWSLGLILFVAVEGYHPMRRDTSVATLAAVLKGEVPVPRQAGPLTGPLRAVLVADPERRPTAEEFDRLLVEAVHATGGTVPSWTGGPTREPTGTHRAAPATAVYDHHDAAGTGEPPSFPSAGGSAPSLPGGHPAPGYPPPGAQFAGSGEYAQPGRPADDASAYGPAGMPPFTDTRGYSRPDHLRAAPAYPGAPAYAPPGEAASIAYPSGPNAEARQGLPRGPLVAGAAAVFVVLAVIVAFVAWPRSGAGTVAADPPAPTPTSAPVPGAPATGKPNSGKPGKGTQAAAPAGNLLTAEGMATAIAALEKVTGGKEFTRTTVYPEYLNTGAPVSGKPKLYDNYTYRNGAGSRTGAGGELDEPTVRLGAIDWSVLPGLFRTAESELGIGTPTMRYFIVEPAWTFNHDKPSLLIYLTDEYGGAYLAADLDGTVVKKYPRN
ncbi:serine/threonine-protein kinase [Nocardia thailandica]